MKDRRHTRNSRSQQITFNGNGSARSIARLSRGAKMIINPYSAQSLACALLMGVAVTDGAPPADPPQAEITNGQIRVKLYLPDTRNGYYRGTRFDWSGVIASLEYKGHNYFGEWFDRFDPKVYDVDFSNGISAGPNSAATG